MYIPGPLAHGIETLRTFDAVGIVLIRSSLFYVFRFAHLFCLVRYALP